LAAALGEYFAGSRTRAGKLMTFQQRHA
jgi:hypothetical protein